MTVLRGASTTSGNSTTASQADRYWRALRNNRSVARWVCPNCEREFASANQAHVCVPGITVGDLVARHPPWVGEIYNAIIEHLLGLGPIHEDAVNVGIFLKSDRKIAEFRPRVRSALLSLYLPYGLSDPRIARVLPASGDRLVSMINLTSVDQVDHQLREWLTEAYDFNTD
jgi:uncharacterized protein DUF5655